ncbi:MAG: ABC transporter ATP-binding protein [Lachnospiraceae bacterium]|nr:ABC transporter ATP-binding protein [Lachnospiraceae bacterium]
MKYYFLSPSDESTSKKRERVSPVGKILQYAGRWKKTVFLAAALMILGSACSVVPYLFVYRLLHTLLSGEAVTLAGSMTAVCGVFAFYALYAVFYVSGLHFSHKAAYHTLENIRCRLQERIEKQPLGNILESGSGALKKLFVDDVESIELLLAHMIPEGIGNIVVAAALLLVMIWADWQMTLFAVITIGFGISASSQMYAVGMDKMGSYFAAAKRLNNTIIEYVNGMEVVRVFNRTKDAGEKYEAHVHGYRDFALYWYRVCWPWMALYGSLFSTVTLYTLPLGALLIVRGALTLSRYLLMLCFSFGLGGLLLHLLGFMGAIPQVSYKIQTLEKTIDRAPLKTGEEAFTGDSHTVTLQDVHFGYRGEEVLKGISLTAREGTMTALVGPSGSGKTTIARLLAHHYDASDGSVRIGGQDIRRMTPEAFSSRIALVSQDLFLFDDTILENIRAGRPDASDEEVYEAARRAQCAEFIAALPEQYETNCGISGAKLSGGERQRISFARAILKDAPVIILDEATAFIDPENEQRMRVAVEEMTKDKTVIMIAHRLQTITHADQIIVLNEGRVEDSGTHDELHARCALYRTLWHRSEDVADWGLKAAGREARA